MVLGNMAAGIKDSSKKRCLGCEDDETNDEEEEEPLIRKGNIVDRGIRRYIVKQFDDLFDNVGTFFVTYLH